MGTRSHFGESLEDFGVLSDDCKGEALCGELFFQFLAMNDQHVAVYCKGECVGRNHGQLSAKCRDSCFGMSNENLNFKAAANIPYRPRSLAFGRVSILLGRARLVGRLFSSSVSTNG